jgi:hypothetical protein
VSAGFDRKSKKRPYTHAATVVLEQVAHLVFHRAQNPGFFTEPRKLRIKPSFATWLAVFISPSPTRFRPLFTCILLHSLDFSSVVHIAVPWVIL